MGQRANYIIKENDQLSIYYNHWRATLIATDLYLGEEDFLLFVRECQQNKVLMGEVWMEGCVIIDMSVKQLHFWSLHFPIETSIIQYYLAELAKKWSGWQVQYVENRMYDMEKILGIDYISLQELTTPHSWPTEKIINEPQDDWINLLIILKDASHLSPITSCNLSAEVIISYGEAIIPLLKEKKIQALPNENDSSTSECIIIDIDKKHIFINRSMFGLWEQCHQLWPEFTFTMSDYGYLHILGLAGISHKDLEMSIEEVTDSFQHIIKLNSFVAPYDIAEKIKKDYGNVQFNPSFFDTVQPRKRNLFFTNIKLGAKKIFGIK